MGEAVFVPSADRFVPTDLASGPWDAGALHGGAPAALIARCFERVEAELPMTWARFSVDLLRPVPKSELTVAVRVSRPGKRVQMLEASLSAGGAEVARATGLRIRRETLDLPAPSPRADATPAGGGPGFRPHAPIGFGGAMEIRVARGGVRETGPAAVWFRLRVPIVEGEESTPLMRVAAAADFGNGLSHELDFMTHLFINPEITIHLYREPAGEWIGLDARTSLGPDGTGLAVSTLHDGHGAVGQAAQSLLVGVRESTARM